MAEVTLHGRLTPSVLVFKSLPARLASDTGFQQLVMCTEFADLLAGGTVRGSVQRPNMRFSNPHTNTRNRLAGPGEHLTHTNPNTNTNTRLASAAMLYSVQQSAPVASSLPPCPM